MRIGKPARVVHELQQLAATARTAAQLVNTSPDPPRALGLFYATFSAGLHSRSLPALVYRGF